MDKQKVELITNRVESGDWLIIELNGERIYSGGSTLTVEELQNILLNCDVPTHIKDVTDEDMSQLG
jgi:hypothetical protein